MTGKSMTISTPLRANFNKFTLWLAGAFVAVLLCGTRANAVPFGYVTNLETNTVSVVDIGTNTVVATIPVGNGPVGLAVTPDGTLVYISNLEDSTVSVLSTASDTVIATIPVGVEPMGLAITPDGTPRYT